MWTIKQTTIDKINERLSNGKNVTFHFEKKQNVAGVLAVLRKAFPNNFVQKYNNTYDKRWEFTIYAGDKEMQKFLHTPIKFETPRQQFNREFKKDMEALKETYNINN